MKNKDTDLLIVLQVVFLALKVAELSTLSWIQTFIPLYIKIGINVVMYTVAYFQIKRENEEKEKKQKNEELEKSFR